MPKAHNLPLVSIELGSTYINIANNNIDDVRISYVKGYWPDLKILNISSNYISKIGLT